MVLNLIFTKYMYKTEFSELSVQTFQVFEWHNSYMALNWNVSSLQFLYITFEISALGEYIVPVLHTTGTHGANLHSLQSR